MTISKEIDGKTLTIHLAGRLDTTTSPALEAEILASVNDIANLIFDFSELEYISSAGLRVILMAQKTMNDKGSMTINNVNDEIKEIFEVTGFSNILTIE